MGDHTSGPWKAQVERYLRVGAGQSRKVLAVSSEHEVIGYVNIENLANARLIAAAPIGDKLARSLLETAVYEPLPIALIDLAKEFVAKAEGL